MFEAVLFDLDGTLVDRDASAMKFLDEQHRSYELNVAPERFRRRFVELDEGGRADKYEVWGALAEEFGIDATADELVAEYRSAAWRFCVAFPGVEKTLRALRAGGYKLGIVTNGTVQMQRAKIELTRLDELVEVVLISEQEGVRKPDAAIFRRAAERLGVVPDACLFVGDNLEADIGGAQGVGMTAVWVGSTALPANSPTQPAYIVKDVREVLDIVTSGGGSRDERGE